MAQLKAIVDKLLTNVSQALIPEGHIADLVFPEVQSKQKTGKIGKYGKGHLRIEHSTVGGRGLYRRSEPIVRSSDSYSITSNGLSGLVSEDDYDNVELPFKAEEDEVMGLTSQIALGKENDISTALGSTAILTQNTTLSGTAQFNDYANSDPIGKFLTARKTVRSGCGLPPNVAIMDWDVANALAFHPGILEALGYAMNRAGQLSDAELAKAMGVEKLLIAKAVYNTAKEGQTDALANVWGKNIVFAQLPQKAAPYQISLGYKMVLSGRSQRRVFKNNVNNPPNSTEILVDDSYQFLIVNAGAGYLIKNAIA